MRKNSKVILPAEEQLIFGELWARRSAVLIGLGSATAQPASAQRSA
jgi:hypothetical protein